MRTKYSTGLFIIIIIITFLSFYITTDNTETVTKEAEVSETLSPDGYYLFENNGVIVVLENDRKTIYEYTDILIEELPTNLQKEISNGKYINSLEDLYGFLENYSS